MTIYDFTVQNNEGKTVSLADYRGKTILVVNTATECGFTPQYANLQALYADYASKGFVILDFPCNQFGNQAPGSDEEIHTFCTARFGVKFPLFKKIDVNGPNASPVFNYLKSQKGFAGFDLKNPLGKALDGLLKQKDPNYAANNDIKWNFTKFLIDKDGAVRARYEPTDSMEKLEEDIKAIL